MLKKDEKSLDPKRPRLIFDPHPSLKALGGWANMILIKAIKLVEPRFIQAENETEINDTIFDMLTRHHSTKMISTDFSAYDGHVHHSTLDVDCLIIKRVLPHLC